MAENTASLEPADPAAAVLDDARQRFIARFPGHCHAIESLLESVGRLGSHGPVAQLRDLLHRLGGHAGAIGFPKVGECARQLETLLLRTNGDGLDVVTTQSIAARFRDAFATDLATRAAGDGAAEAIRSQPLRILVVEDHDGLREGIVEYLATAGFAANGLRSADTLADDVRSYRPAAIVLDVALPGTDGFAACRALKSDPELAQIPILFLTGQTDLDARLAGLALGAEAFLVKPVDPRELALRLRLTLQRHDRSDPPPADERRREPGLVVIADDDPEVTRIVDAQLRMAGYDTFIAFDGEAAMDAIATLRPDCLVLDLMIPKVSGFDILTRVRQLPSPRPSVVVVSGRTREEDIMRAFALGADDYMTKPFSPQELLARVERRVR